MRVRSTELIAIQDVCLDSIDSVQELKVFKNNLEALPVLQRSKQNIEQIKRKNTRLLSAPRIKKSWRVKPTIRGRLPFY